MNKLFPIVLALMCFGFIFCQQIESDGILYLGYGQPSSSSIEESNKNTSVVGFMWYVQRANAHIGLEYAKEGTLLSSTWGRNDAIEQGSSTNLSFSGTLPLKIKDTKATIGFLIGSRVVKRYCPSGDSFLGLECYAGEDAKSVRKPNVGMLFTTRHKKTIIGLRHTSESSQIMLGFKLPLFE
tara:strand:- start:435 stop:980 length:546 start_codon:yes stop_codon:yes gene_type:complete